MQLQRGMEGTKKLRGSHHSGRTNSKGQAFNVNHNDRKFKQEKSAEYDRHIDTSRSEQNYYIAFNMENPAKALKVNPERFDLRDIELGFYKKHFGAHLEQTNAKYVKNRHKERVRTIEDIYTNPRTCPQETILQVGKDGNYRNEKLFRRMVHEYCTIYNEQYSRNSMIIDCAIHADETSLHAHVRRVFYVQDQDGNLELAQNKALEQLGYDLPLPEQKRSKYNNRLQTFTDDLREFWYQTIEKHDKSIKIEREPKYASKTSLEKLDYQNESVKEKLEVVRNEYTVWDGLVEERKEELIDLENKCSVKINEVERLEALQSIAEKHVEEPKFKAKKTLLGKGTIVEDAEPEEIEDMFRLVQVMDTNAIMLQRERDVFEQEKKEQEEKSKEEREKMDLLEREFYREYQEFQDEKKAFEDEKLDYETEYYAAGFEAGKKDAEKAAEKEIRELSIAVARLESIHNMDIMLCRKMGIDLPKLEQNEVNRQQLQKQIREMETLVDREDVSKNHDDWELDR